MVDLKEDGPDLRHPVQVFVPQNPVHLTGSTGGRWASVGMVHFRIGFFRLFFEVAKLKTSLSFAGS